MRSSCLGLWQTEGIFTIRPRFPPSALAQTCCLLATVLMSWQALGRWRRSLLTIPAESLEQLLVMVLAKKIAVVASMRMLASGSPVLALFFRVATLGLNLRWKLMRRFCNEVDFWGQRCGCRAMQFFPEERGLKALLLMIALQLAPSLSPPCPSTPLHLKHLQRLVGSMMLLDCWALQRKTLRQRIFSRQQGQRLCPPMRQWIWASLLLALHLPRGLHWPCCPYVLQSLSSPLQSCWLGLLVAGTQFCFTEDVWPRLGAEAESLKDLGKTVRFLFLALWPKSSAFWLHLHLWRYQTLRWSTTRGFMRLMPLWAMGRLSPRNLRRIWLKTCGLALTSGAVTLALIALPWLCWLLLARRRMICRRSLDRKSQSCFTMTLLSSLEGLGVFRSVWPSLVILLPLAWTCQALSIMTWRIADSWSGACIWLSRDVLQLFFQSLHALHLALQLIQQSGHTKCLKVWLALPQNFPWKPAGKQIFCAASSWPPFQQALWERTATEE